MRGACRWMRLTGGVLMAALLLSAGSAGPAAAHQERVDLAFWGNFGTETARCQRTISRAAAVCARQMIDIRNACMGAQLVGNTCDPAAIDAAQRAARDRARMMVEHTCTGPQVQILRYLDVSEAVTDVINLCGQLDTAAVSAVYGPALVGGTVAAVDDSTHSCLTSTAAAAAKLLRFAIVTRQRTFDRIAAKNLGPSDKLALVARSAQRIARGQMIIGQQIERVCPADQFQSVYGRQVQTFLERVAQRADCLADAVYVQNAVTCPAPTCGNGMQEPGEECDDGNSFEGDGCRSNCTKSNCDVFPSTYDLIQQAIFENHGCTADACHGSGRSGGLDLRADVSYQNLIDMPAQSVVGVKRVDPGSKDTSLLWINLAAKTLPDQWRAPLQPMPIGLDALSTDEVEALRLWIEKGGASRTGSVEGTASLLQACLPEPKPVEITPLPPPAPGEGVQIHMPAWTLAPGSESEVCFSSYFDFSAQVPAELLNADGTKFRYKEVQIRQNPLSHHLIVDIYRGSEAADDPAWGPYTCKAGPHKGEACNPYDLDFCREAGACATDPDPYAIACIGFGPQTSFSTLVNGGLAFAQESAAEFRFPAGVFSEVPVKGIALFNSHAFNLTRQTGKMEAWMNIYFPKPEEQKHQEVQIFDTSKIFWTDSFPPFPLPELAPFEKMEVCQIHTFRSSIDPPNEFDPAVVSPGKTVHLFELSGHMHEHGKRFQIFRGSFTCKGGTKAGAACSPFNADLCPEGTCTEDTGRDPQQSLLYTNLIYNDPVVLRFDTPLLFSGAAPSAERSLTYCAVYDNGAPPNIQDVKRRSTSPPAGSIIGIKVGGPCRPSKTRCIGGPHHNEACNGDNAACDSSPGAGDGDCDACPLTGGFRTKDEMFILFGNFWVE